MNYNPYAPPQALPPTPGPGYVGQPQPWEIGEVLTGAWEAFKPNWVVLVFGMVVGWFVGALPSAIPPVLVAVRVVRENSAPYWVIYGLFSFIGIVVGAFFQVGFVRIWIKAARGERPEFDELFSGGSRFLPMLGATLLLGLAVCLGSMLCLVPGIIAGLGLMFMPYYVVDQQMGPLEAMAASWTATTGQKGSLFVFSLITILLAVAGLMACCLGLFVAMPVIAIATATVYLRISGRAPAPRGGVSL
jgi:hypothetical protein